MVPVGKSFSRHSRIWVALFALGMGATFLDAARLEARQASSAYDGIWEEFLVRVEISRPTPELLSKHFGLPVKSLVHIDEDLYKVVLPKGASLEKSLLENDVVTHFQKNFIYRPQLMRPNLEKNYFDVSDLDLLADPEVGEPPQSSPQSTDPSLGKQWGLDKTRAQGAWQLTRGSEEVIVAVIDTGVDYNHEDLSQNIWRNPGEIPGNEVDDDNNGYVDDVVGYDFADDDPLPYDVTSDVLSGGNPGHGTHCAGVVAAVGRNGRGISGVAPQVKVMPIRFISEKGEGTTEAAIKAIKYAVNQGATILSNSWGGEDPDELDAELRRVLRWAQEKGVLSVFASGNGRDGRGYNNDTDPRPTVPASFDLAGIFSIAAIDRQDRLGPFSNYGVKTVDMAAPGVRIFSTVPQNRYEDRISVSGVPIGDWSGTSMATPHVAGAAALIKSLYPSLKGTQIKQILMDSARPLSILERRVASGGTLDILAALERAQSVVGNP